jgi:hypothetical protein
MGQKLSIFSAGKSRPLPRQGGADLTELRPVTRSRKAPQPLVRVPMLDWPANLFSSNATIAELMSQDWALRTSVLDQFGPGSYAQAAA